MYTRRLSQFHLLHVAAAVICFFFSISVSVPISTQERPDACLVSNLLVAQDTGSGVRVSHKNSLPDSIQQSVTLPGDHLPSICGPHFSRCNMILVNDSAMLYSILVVPVRRGVALIPYVVINGSVQLESYHVLELSSAQIGDTMCQIMTLYDFSDSATRNVIGLCLNEVNIRRISIMIDFNNLSQSSLSRYIYDVPITLHLSRNLSNFVAITNSLPLCWEGLLNSLAYYFDQSSFGLFDVISEGSYPEEYTLYYGNGDVFVCSIPHQLVRVSEQNLIIYCENVTAEIDMCEFSGSSVYNVKFYNESSGGVPYYCSSDMSSYIMVSDKTVTFNSTINHTIPLMSNESIYSGDCIRNGDNVLFAVTTTIGNIYLLDLQKQDGVLLKVRNQPIFAQHQVYNESILYTNGSSTILYNTSCLSDPHRIIIDHPYHLALHMLGEGMQPCFCSQQVLQESTTEPGPEIEPSDNKILTIVIPLVILVTVMIVVLGIMVVWVIICCRRSTERFHRRPLDQSKKMDSQNSTNKEMEASTSFTVLTFSEGRKDVKGQSGPGPGVEAGEGGRGGVPEKAEKAAAENASTQPNSSSSNQSESATVDGVRLDLAQQSVETSFTDLPYPEGKVDVKGRSSPGPGEGGRGGVSEKAEKAAAEDAATQPNSSSSNQSESATVDGVKLDLAQQSVDTSCGTLDQLEQVQSDSGTGTCCQENSWKNSEKRSMVLTSPHQDPFEGIPRAANASEENLTWSHCNESDVSEGVRASNFSSSLGNSGNHPNPTTTPVECSDNGVN